MPQNWNEFQFFKSIFFQFGISMIFLNSNAISLQFWNWDIGIHYGAPTPDDPLQRAILVQLYFELNHLEMTKSGKG